MVHAAACSSDPLLVEVSVRQHQLFSQQLAAGGGRQGVERDLEVADREQRELELFEQGGEILAPTMARWSIVNCTELPSTLVSKPTKLMRSVVGSTRLSASTRSISGRESHRQGDGLAGGVGEQVTDAHPIEGDAQILALHRDIISLDELQAADRQFGAGIVVACAGTDAANRIAAVAIK